MFTIRAFINSWSTRSASIILAFVCIGFLMGCLGDVGSPELHVSGAGFNFRNSDFSAEKTVEIEIPVENHSSVNIEAINGKVMVTGHRDVDVVVVTAHLIIGSDSQADADNHIEDLEIQVTDSAEEILFQTVQPKNTDGRKYHVEYDIIVPHSLEVMATQDNGKIEILDIENSVDVSNTNGDVLLSNIAGGVMAVVDNGSIEGNVFLPVGKTIDLSTNNGNLELNIPTTTSAEFSTTVVNGHISVTDLDFTDIVNTKQRIDGVIGDGEGTIELSTTNGNIELIGFDAIK